jgi:transcriptional regulator with XRE-family HTH domain
MLYNLVMTPIERILELAARRGFTLRRLTEAAGVEEARIHRWKSGEGKIFATHLHGMARALGVSMDMLWTGEEAPAALERSQDDETVLEEMRRLDLTHMQAIRRLRAPEAPPTHAVKIASLNLDDKLPGQPGITKPLNDPGRPKRPKV